MRSAGIDSAALALRDSLYKAVYAVQGADSLGAHIEDYSLGHIGLQRFFAALKNRRELNRPVRVAFLGDSFIEGDIMVADFRSGMQKEFGGGCWFCTGHIRSGTVPSNRGATCLRMDYLVYADRS